MTAYQHRLIIVCPVARFAALVAWYAANIDPTDAGATWPELNAAGDDAPANYRWCSTALTDAQLKAVLLRVCTIASQTPPTNNQWNAWTRAQKQSWLAGVRDAMFTASGIWLDLCQQDAEWTDPEAALTRCAIKRRREAAT